MISPFSFITQFRSTWARLSSLYCRSSMGVSPTMPADTPVTKCRMGSSLRTPSSTSFRQARASATNPPVTEAVRVPPSPWSTSQSMVMVRSPSFVISTAARRDRPTSRWISALRGESFSLEMSRRLRSRLARGSMEYSAVTQPAPSGTWGGALSSTLAQQRTMVSPHRMRQLPSANFTKPGVMVTGRSSSSARPSCLVCMESSPNFRHISSKQRSCLSQLASRGPLQFLSALLFQRDNQLLTRGAV